MKKFDALRMTITTRAIMQEYMARPFVYREIAKKYPKNTVSRNPQMPRTAAGMYIIEKLNFKIARTIRQISITRNIGKGMSLPDAILPIRES